MARNQKNAKIALEIRDPRGNPDDLSTLANWMPDVIPNRGGTSLRPARTETPYQISEHNPEVTAWGLAPRDPRGFPDDLSGLVNWMPDLIPSRGKSGHPEYTPDYNPASPPLPRVGGSDPYSRELSKPSFAERQAQILARQKAQQVVDPVSQVQRAESPPAPANDGTQLMNALAGGDQFTPPPFTPPTFKPSPNVLVFDEQTGDIDPNSKRQFMESFAHNDMNTLGVNRRDQGVSGTEGLMPSNWGQYKQAARSQQYAMNNGAKSAYRPGMQDQSPLVHELMPNQVAELPAWRGPGNPRNTAQQVAYAETLKNLKANQEGRLKGYDQELKHRKDNFIAQQMMGIMPSDRSPQAGMSRALLAALGEQGHSPQQAVNALTAGAPQSTGAFEKMSPKLQQMWAFMNPEAFSAMNQRGPDLQGQAAVTIANAKAKELEAAGGLDPVTVGVKKEQKGQKLFDEGKLPPEHWDQFKPILSKLVPPAHHYVYASSRKKDFLKAAQQQYPHLDQTQLGAWYDSEYGAPWTN